jgi:hypothetical protein
MGKMKRDSTASPLTGDASLAGGPFFEMDQSRVGSKTQRVQLRHKCIFTDISLLELTLEPLL